MLVYEKNDQQDKDKIIKDSGNKEKRAKKYKKKSPMEYPQIFLFHALIVVTVLWFMFGFSFGFMLAPNYDMSPSIEFGDLCLYYRLNKSYKSQDIVILRKNETTYMARVVAAGGDTVDITDDERLLINGNSVVERTIFYRTPRYEGFVEYPVKLEPDNYFVLVDSRLSGEDSRYYGTVSKKEILGKVVAVAQWNNL